MKLIRRAKPVMTKGSRPASRESKDSKVAKIYLKLPIVALMRDNIGTEHRSY